MWAARRLKIMYTEAIEKIEHGYRMEHMCIPCTSPKGTDQKIHGSLSGFSKFYRNSLI
jgi:hypothetical protein